VYSGTAPIVWHVYQDPGRYQVQITGDFPRITIPSASSKRLKSIDQWGDIQWTSMNGAFKGVENMQILATDTPNLTQVTDMTSMFENTKNLTGNFSGWDMSHVTTMYRTFYNAQGFNSPLENWITSGVTTMEGMFSYASAFNQNIATWDVGNVTRMYDMFYGATNFNTSLSGWNTSKVARMDRMFR
jgi:surface protein